jgi:hypothetical protein
MSKSADLGNDYKMALGALVIETSKLESKLTEIIAALAKINIVEALVLVHPAPFAQKLDMLRALFRLIYPDENDPNYAPIREMLGRVKDTYDFRSSVVHALWRVDEGVPHAVRFQRRGKLTRSAVPAPIERIRQCTVEAIASATELDALAQAYRGFAKLDPQPEEQGR